MVLRIGVIDGKVPGHIAEPRFGGCVLEGFLNEVGASVECGDMKGGEAIPWIDLAEALAFLEGSVHVIYIVIERGFEQIALRALEMLSGDAARFQHGRYPAANAV